MTMIERENENISAVNTGCRPKVPLLPDKTEISTELALESCSAVTQEATLDVSGSVSQIKALSENKQQMAVTNSPDLDSKPSESVKPPPQRSKHVRSFSDCTGLSSTSSDRYQTPPFLQAGKAPENAQGNKKHFPTYAINV